jgi:MFS transporter, DHA2 family, glioxin efflux transporter
MQNIITTAIPEITDEFKDLNSVAWVCKIWYILINTQYGTAMFLTSSCLQGPWGKICKLFNLKWVNIGALLIFEIGSLVCGVHLPWSL